jgi:hypothetical protein
MLNKSENRTAIKKIFEMASASNKLLDEVEDILDKRKQ